MTRRDECVYGGCTLIHPRACRPAHLVAALGRAVRPRAHGALPSGMVTLAALSSVSLTVATDDIQKNELKELPGAVLARLPLLQILDVSYNSIKALPLELGRLQDLRELNIRCVCAFV